MSCIVCSSSSRDPAAVEEAGRQHLLLLLTVTPAALTVTPAALQTAVMLVALRYVGRCPHIGLLQLVEPRRRARRRG